MLKNGTLNSTVIRMSNASVGSEHLIDLDGNADYCLFVKDMDLCICDKFVDEGVKVVVPPRGKLPKNQEVQVSYVQTLSQM